jgi:hypothetical protein
MCHEVERCQLSLVESARRRITITTKATYRLCLLKAAAFARKTALPLKIHELLQLHYRNNMALYSCAALRRLFFDIEMSGQGSEANAEG